MARRSRTHRDQTDLFAALGPVGRHEPTVSSSGLGGAPDVVLAVLDDIYHGRYGLINGNGRLVELIEDGDKCRVTELEETIEHLLKQGFTKEGKATVCRHGAVIKRVDVLRLTPSGKQLYYRWSALASMTG